MTRFVNFALYQTGWFACVLGAAWQLPWIGCGIALALIGIHFWLAADRGTEIRIAIAAAFVGFAVDSGQLWIGSFRFPHGSIVEWLPPPWMTLLWMQFATTFRYSMKWLSQRYLRASLFGLLGAPAAFFAGERLGAIDFLAPRALHFVILAVVWAIAVPLLIWISDRRTGSSDAGGTYRGPMFAEGG